MKTMGQKTSKTTPPTLSGGELNGKGMAGGGLAVAAMAALAGVAYGYLVETRHPVLERVVIPVDALPRQLDGLRILLLSDLHVSHARWRQRRARRFVSLAMGLSFDIILMTGDYGNMPHDVHLAYPMLSRLHAPLGVWAVPGNHDRDYTIKQRILGMERMTPSISRLRLEFAALGIQLLVNESAAIERQGQRLYLVGVDNYVDGHGDLSRALEGVPEEGAAIMLTHTPDAIMEVKAPPVRLVLAGHTHGGQVVIPGLGPPFMPTALGRCYSSGLLDYNGVPLYITRGLSGNIGLRLNCPPEITLITLRRMAG